MVLLTVTHRRIVEAAVYGALSSAIFQLGAVVVVATCHVSHDPVVFLVGADDEATRVLEAATVQALAQVLRLPLSMHPIQISSDLASYRMRRFPQRVQVGLVALMLILLYLGEFDRIVIIDTFIIVLVIAVVVRCVVGGARLLIQMGRVVVSRAALLAHSLVTMVSAAYTAGYRMTSCLEDGAVHVRASSAVILVRLVHRLRLVPLAAVQVLRSAVLAEAARAHLMPILISVGRRR